VQTIRRLNFLVQISSRSSKKLPNSKTYLWARLKNSINFTTLSNRQKHSMQVKHTVCMTHTHTHTHTHTQPFYSSVKFVRENSGEPVPEETFTHYSHRSHQSSLCMIIPRQYKFFNFYCTIHYSAKRGLAIACHLSVCLSVCDVGGS